MTTGAKFRMDISPGFCAFCLLPESAGMCYNLQQDVLVFVNNVGVTGLNYFDQKMYGYGGTPGHDRRGNAGGR